MLTSIEFLTGGTKVYETPLVEANSLNVPDRGAVAFQFDVPLAQLKPGTYVCQVNVIDDAGGSFSFPRMALRVQARGAPAPPRFAAPAAATPGAAATDASSQQHLDAAARRGAFCSAYRASSGGVLCVLALLLSLACLCRCCAALAVAVWRSRAG